MCPFQERVPSEPSQPLKYRLSTDSTTSSWRGVNVGFPWSGPTWIRFILSINFCLLQIYELASLFYRNSLKTMTPIRHASFASGFERCRSFFWAKQTGSWANFRGYSGIRPKMLSHFYRMTKLPSILFLGKRHPTLAISSPLRQPCRAGATFLLITL